MTEKQEELNTRRRDFSLLQLPGQPMMMPMGTSRLIDDLWAEIVELQKELEDD